jgi:hypothetical protein
MKYRAEAGISAETWFHDYRRSYATNARRRGVDESGRSCGRRGTGPAPPSTATTSSTTPTSAPRSRRTRPGKRPRFVVDATRISTQRIEPVAGFKAELKRIEAERIDPAADVERQLRASESAIRNVTDAIAKSGSTTR